MQALDHGNAEAEFGSALVHIMFALAARYDRHPRTPSEYYLTTVIRCIVPNSSAPAIHSDKPEAPGERWAKKANDMIFQNLGMPNVRSLMVRSIAFNPLLYL